MKRCFGGAWLSAVTAWAALAEAQSAAPPPSPEPFDPCSTSSELVRLLTTQTGYRGSEGFDARACPLGPSVDGLEMPSASGDEGHGLALRGRAGMGIYLEGGYDSPLYTPTLLLSVKGPGRAWQATASYAAYARASQPVDVLSAASSSEDGSVHLGTLRAEVARGRARLGLAGGLLAGGSLLGLTAGAFVSHEHPEEGITPTLSYRLGYDELGRPGTSLAAERGEISTHLLDGGLSLRVNPATTLLWVATASLVNGDSSARGRYVPVFTSEVARRLERGASWSEVDRSRLDITLSEQLPTSRRRFALLNRLVHHFATGALRFDERLYIDAWGLASSTTDVRSWHLLTRSLTLGPHFRVHAQEGVDFWRRAYIARGTDQGVALPPHRTLDTNLGPLLETTVGGGLRWSFSRGVALDLLADGVHTEILDALFVTDRWGFLTMSTLELGGD